MSEMVYRVAKAIGEANLVHLADWGFSISAPAMNELARAAIAAMREPTAEMIRAGELTLTEPTDIHGYPCACSEEAVWKAMMQEQIHMTNEELSSALSRAALKINERTRNMQAMAEEKSGVVFHGNERERLRQKADVLDCLFIVLGVLSEYVKEPELRSE